jgi:hypothetical protein
MAIFDELLDAVKNQIVRHVPKSQHGAFDTDGLIGKISDIFGQHAQRAGTRDNPRSASEDPYGDPADEGRSATASRDVRPASEDPYGDPADEPRRR